MSIKINTKARLVHPVIEGTVLDTEWNKGKGCPHHLVEFIDADGHTRQRWFDEDLLEAVEEPEAEQKEEPV
jgi:hypothetical protein